MIRLQKIRSLTLRNVSFHDVLMQFVYLFFIKIHLPLFIHQAIKMKFVFQMLVYDVKFEINLGEVGLRKLSLPLQNEASSNNFSKYCNSVI